MSFFINFSIIFAIIFFTSGSNCNFPDESQIKNRFKVQTDSYLLRASLDPISGNITQYLQRGNYYRIINRINAASAKFGPNLQTITYHIRLGLTETQCRLDEILKKELPVEDCFPVESKEYQCSAEIVFLFTGSDQKLDIKHPTISQSYKYSIEKVKCDDDTN